MGGATRDQIIVLEYDQTDRLGFVLTQTGDRTFAVDFRDSRSLTVSLRSLPDRPTIVVLRGV